MSFPALERGNQTMKHKFNIRISFWFFPVVLFEGFPEHQGLCRLILLERRWCLEGELSLCCEMLCVQVLTNRLPVFITSLQLLGYNSEDSVDKRALFGSCLQGMSQCIQIAQVLPCGMREKVPCLLWRDSIPTLSLMEPTTLNIRINYRGKLRNFLQFGNYSSIISQIFLKKLSIVLKIRVWQRKMSKPIKSTKKYKFWNRRF